jgi:hypothetical protein
MGESEPEQTQEYKASEEKKLELQKRFKALRLNAVGQSKTMLNALNAKHTYKYTRAGKTKRS